MNPRVMTESKAKECPEGRLGFLFGMLSARSSKIFAQISKD